MKTDEQFREEGWLTLQQDKDFFSRLALNRTGKWSNEGDNELDMDHASNMRHLYSQVIADHLEQDTCIFALWRTGKYLGKDLKDFEATCTKLGIEDTVWTIDIAYILVEFGIKQCMCTITLGVDPGYHKESYYKHSLKTEEVRVNQKFEQAHSSGVDVKKKSVTIDEILHHLSQGLLIILLIDWSIMVCEWCHQNGIAKLFSSCSSPGCCCQSYIGHYIVLCGYDTSVNTIFYKNPGINKELCCCTFDTLEKARMQYGTDEDIIFVHGHHSSLSSCGVNTAEVQLR